MSKRQKNFSSDAVKLAEIVPRIMNLFYRLTHGMHCPSDFTIPQFKILQNLHEVKLPIGMSDLSARLGVSQSTVTDTIKKLVRQGYVEKRRSPTDERIVLVSLTQKSKTVMENHLKGLTNFLNDLLTQLPKQKRKLLITSHEAILGIYSELDEAKNT